MLPIADAWDYHNRPVQALQTALDMETHFPKPSTASFLKGYIFTGLPLNACSARPAPGVINAAGPQPSPDQTPDRSHHHASASTDERG